MLHVAVSVAVSAAVTVAAAVAVRRRDSVSREL